VDQQGRRGPGEQQSNPGGRRSPQIRGAAVAAAGGGEGRGEQRGRRGQERGVGRREGALERVGVGEEGAEVVDGADEVVEVGAAELLDLGLPVPHRGTERGEQRLGAAARERPAHEGAQVLPSRDGGGELREVRLGRGVGGRSAPGAVLFSSLPIHRSALSVSLPNRVDCKRPASISRAALGSRSISRRWLDFLPCTRSPARLPCFLPGLHVWRPPHPIGRPGDAYGRLDDAFGARRTPYAVDQGESDAQVGNRALSPRRRLGDA